MSKSKRLHDEGSLAFDISTKNMKHGSSTEQSITIKNFDEYDDI